MTPIDFYFDPGCPWTWITARWVAEVAPARDLDVTWKSYSLKLRNEHNAIPEEIRQRLEAQFRGLRVIEAARADHGQAAAGDLYRAIGARIHHDGDAGLDGLADAIAAAGLPTGLIGAANDGRLDDVIAASTEAGRALVGDDVGVPIVAFGDARPTYFGPVMSPAPTGDAALALWDAYVAITRFPGVFEMKRTRQVGPQFGPRP